MEDNKDFSGGEINGFDSNESIGDNNSYNVSRDDNNIFSDSPQYTSSNIDSDFKSNEYHFVTNPERVAEIKNGKKNNKKYSLSTVLLSVVIAAVISALVGSGFSAYLMSRTSGGQSALPNESGSEQLGNASQQQTTITINDTVDSVIEAVALKVNPSVVGIATTAASTSFFGGAVETTGEGSGIVYTADGYIITNYHVIKSAVNSSSKIEVYLSGNTEKSYEATVVGYNISYDLAVIKIQASNLTIIELANSDELRVGQFVAAIGSPGGLQFMGSVSYGIVSGLNRVVSDSSSGADIELIQTDAAINPGNSGGALVNTKGQLIGVNSSKIAATEYEGMGFAIPVNTVKEICDNIIAKENDPNPYIGITLSEKYDAQTLQSLGYPAGAVVKSVIDGGPASKSGIRSGDIIVEFNSVAIESYTQIADEVAKCTPGTRITVKIYRSGRYYSTSVQVGSNNSQ